MSDEKQREVGDWLAKNQSDLGIVDVTLADLPPPPSGRTGWPWTKAPTPLPPTMTDGAPWPRISIVTPSYNQGQYIEETIRSVLLQGYPNLEYIIIDGGSTDESVELIRKYEPWLTYWVSEKDRGQAHAINKGFERVSGSVFGWINSDDLHYPSVLKEIADAFVVEKGWITGRCDAVDDSGAIVDRYIPDLPKQASEWAARFLTGMTYSIAQPSTFWSALAWKESGPLDEGYRFIFDHLFFLKLFERYGAPTIVAQTLSRFRLHESSKTVSSQYHFKLEMASAGEQLGCDAPVATRLAASRIAARTRGYAFLYEATLAHQIGDREQANTFLLRAIRHYPLVLLSRPFLGYLRRLAQAWVLSRSHR